MNLSNIVGSGFIAKSFKSKNRFFKKNKCLLYAAGVSNSNSKNRRIFTKDFNRLKKIKNFSSNLKIIYISSCSIGDPTRNNSIFIKNKIKIEKLIKKYFKSYLIIRLPEIIGKNKNKNTLVNFFYNNIKKNKKMILYKNAFRNFIYIGDVINILNEIIKKKNNNLKIKIASSNMTNVYKIVNIFEKLLNKKANLNFRKYTNKKFKININKIKNLKSFKKINFNENYLNKYLATYLK